MVQDVVTRLIVEVAKEIGVAPATVAVREATSCGTTKAGMSRLLRHAAGKTAFLYSFDNGDIFWKGC